VVSVMHDERAALSAEPPARHRTLLRRLMVVCPTTGHPAATGFELSGLPKASARQQILVDCLEWGDPAFVY